LGVFTVKLHLNVVVTAETVFAIRVRDTAL